MTADSKVVARWDVEAKGEGLDSLYVKEFENYSGPYVLFTDHERVLGELRAEIEALVKDADRYRWLRNPRQDVGLVLDKVVGETPMDEQGFGGYKHYEYRSGEELDIAIDAAMKERGE